MPPGMTQETLILCKALTLCSPAMSCYSKGMTLVEMNLWAEELPEQITIPVPSSLLFPLVFCCHSWLGYSSCRNKPALAPGM